MYDGGVAAVSGRQKKKRGKVRYDVKSIQVGEEAQVAGSCRGMDAQSIQTPVPDKEQDYRCLRGENRNRNAWMASQTHRQMKTEDRLDR